MRKQPLPDVIAHDLDVLFCGINPGLLSAALGYHFARPGNRFWPTIHRAGFTPRQLAPSEQQELLRYGCGITNLVDRPTASADELTREELVAGSRVVARKVRKFAPRYVAIVGVGAYRVAFARPRAKVGLQEETIGDSRLWLLPNPSGLNAHYKPSELVEVYRELKDAMSEQG